MKTILIVSVGGSPQPVINAVLNHKPDFVYFFCSTGPKGSDKIINGYGDVCADTRTKTCPNCGQDVFIGDPKGKAVVVQAGLSESQYGILGVDDPDDLTECYSRLTNLAGIISTKFGETCRVIANYTGGTKTMSVAMAMVAVMTEKWDLEVNKGPRPDLIKVRDGDTPIIVDKWSIYCSNQMILVRKAISDFDYAYAVTTISEMMDRPLEKDLQKRLLNAKVICQAFDSWDKFQHGRAFELLKNHGELYPEYLVSLKRLLGKFRDSTGYEMVGDLLNNASRRAHRGYYDDAVSRVYRAVELFAQTRLRINHNIDTDDMILDTLPVPIRSEYESRVRQSGRIFLGLRDDYELLFKLNDSIGGEYKRIEKKFNDALTRRNMGIGAHGVDPLDWNDYELVNDVLGGFLTSVADALEINITTPQLPQHLDSLG